MDLPVHGRVSDLQSFTDPARALDRITEIYEASVAKICGALDDFVRNGRKPDLRGAGYPYVGITVDAEAFDAPISRAYGTLPASGTFGTTLTRPDLFASYYLDQLALIMKSHAQPVVVGVADGPIPLPFVVEAAEMGLDAALSDELRRHFPVPNIACIDDSIANGTYVEDAGAGRPRPLALFEAERADYSLVRLTHYTGTSPDFFQRFVLFTNYQRYVEEFIEYGKAEVASGEVYKAFVQPGNRIEHNPKLTDTMESRSRPSTTPQMPAYHLVRDKHMGITLVNIGIGPSNAKTITDHLAVLRPHCWIMVGHCGGLRKTQRLGDYVLAHAYARSDHVLDEDLPVWVPVPPIAEIQVALTQAVAEITGLSGVELKSRLRTGTVFTTDDRDWELRQEELARRLHHSRAIAVDMESATIATNGYRFRVPYGTLLCVSDKPLHGELKLPGMANQFYRERIHQHLRIGIATIQSLSDKGVEALHSRKLRSFDEPAFR
jgi:AMP nucleosidase